MDTKIKEVSLKKRLVTLFFSMLSISAFTFGGGFVIVTLMKRRFVDDLHWLDEDEMLDMTAIAQSCPGAIAVNGAILVGQRVAGAAGIVVATIATIIPPMVILSLVSYFYALFADNPYVAAVLAGMQAGVAAVIVDVVLNLGAGVLKTEKSSCSKPKSQAAQTRKLETIKHIPVEGLHDGVDHAGHGVPGHELRYVGREEHQLALLVGLEGWLGHRKPLSRRCPFTATLYHNTW